MYQLNTGTEILPFEDFTAAREAADLLANDQGLELQVIHAETGAVAYAINYSALQGGYFNPLTRVETPKFATRAFEGFVPAYHRVRIQSTVYRAQDGAGWRVLDGRSGNFRDVSTTKESCTLLVDMRKGLVL